MKDIKYLTYISTKDKNALKNIEYLKLQCEKDFCNLLVKKPWGSEYLLFENKLCAIWILNVKHLEHTSMHCHPQKNTSLVCLDAQVSCNTLDDSYTLSSLDGIFFHKKVFHQTLSISLEGSCILEIETPVNKFDLVRINDTYGRQGKEYEGQEHYTYTKNLSLDLQNNTKIINNTKIEIRDIFSFDDLLEYDETSIVALLSKSVNIGRIFRIKDINISFIKKGISNTVLIISKNKNII